MRLDLVGPLIAVRGHASPEVAEAVEKALELYGRVGAKHRIVPALTLKWLAQLGGDNLEALYATALQIAEEARGAEETDRLLSHRTLGSTLMFRGELAGALDELQHFMALYDPAAHEAALAKAGATTAASVVVLALAETSFLMGDRQAAAEWRRAMFELGARKSHVPSLCQILAFGGCWLAALGGDWDDLALHAAELRRLTTRHEIVIWRPHADLLCGLAELRHGAPEAGFALARQGFDGLLQARSYLMTTWCLLYADACEQHGRVDELAEALAITEPRIRRGERWLEAEFLRLRARLGIVRGDSADAVAADFEAAVAVARRQGARFLEMRAAADQARSARPGESRQLEVG
jgi:adenylate cyclase